LLCKFRRRLSYHQIAFAVGWKQGPCGPLNHESSAADLIYDKTGLCKPAIAGVWRAASP
jgi:hypothetical protein